MIGVGSIPEEEAALKNVVFDSPAFDDSLHYKVPEKLLAVKMPPMPRMKAVTPWSSNANVELINPWRYWNLQTKQPSLEKQILTDSDGSGRVIRVIGNFGTGSSLVYNFGKTAKLEPGRYRFEFRARGTPGQSVAFDLADGWRRISEEVRIPLTDEWQEHSLPLEIKTPFQDETTLRFRLQRDANGAFDLSDTRLKLIQ